MRYGVWLLSMSMLPAGCPSLWPDGRVCTTLFAYGVSVYLTDAASGEPVSEATLTLVDGDYAEVMEFIPTGAYVGAGERKGTYTLTIEVPGRPMVTVNDVVVRHDGCHVIGVSFDAVVEADQVVVTRRPSD